MNATGTTDEGADVVDITTSPAIGVIALKFVALLTVIVALFALAWSR